ncbi:Crp/Fnr family transcriptional regulator [Paraburkholderia tropica]|uniref:Crp/Fnr family transcriptional regulator n=1 Tax=Paraburkholderia tropica TaxID=92647 RepID=A0AAQ1GBF5_9BURK|nr:Crp/Fnr family transcriptional regulator [Paraburkholderia tropica]MDE1139389.1 Crp/Fnr family transcriptional regulator [Paraburkholderia tropica]PXX19836.1 Crp/Fnr family transcriptional regulator [Paraburkholderia tropica]PZW88777.1 Crp/Fnr family transcriptional regulator [Paraburkholderia tropica]RQN40011.1 Crp/Fnr family transcriptional regulator [Paraburkholderia tropica]SEI87410.1 transcriptional regulator, Crp/Fnr family [Paraburkholderia tropica]
MTSTRPASPASSANVVYADDAAAVSAALERSAWFAAAPAPLRAALRAAGRVRVLRAGERLFLRGDAADGLYCVLDGAMRVGAASMTGREALLAVVGPAHWFGEIALFDAGVRTHDAYAERDSTLFHVPSAPLAALLAATPAYWHAFGLLLAQKLRFAFDAIEESALLPAAARVARRLLVLAADHGGTQSARRVVNVPQEDLALMLALSRQTVNQILRQFERDGLVQLRYGEIEIVDAVRLEQQAH